MHFQNLNISRDAGATAPQIWRKFDYFWKFDGTLLQSFLTWRAETWQSVRRVSYVLAETYMGVVGGYWPPGEIAKFGRLRRHRFLATFGLLRHVNSAIAREVDYGAMLRTDKCLARTWNWSTTVPYKGPPANFPLLVKKFQMAITTPPGGPESSL